MTILKVAMFKDEATNSDKIWGIAKINNSHVTFWGRRNSTLRFKTMPGKEGINEAKLIFNKKINKGYVPVKNPKLIHMLMGDLGKNCSSNFFSAMRRGKLNTKH